MHHRRCRESGGADTRQTHVSELHYFIPFLQGLTQDLVESYRGALMICDQYRSLVTVLHKRVPQLAHPPLFSFFAPRASLSVQWNANRFLRLCVNPHQSRCSPLVQYWVHKPDTPAVCVRGATGKRFSHAPSKRHRGCWYSFGVFTLKSTTKGSANYSTWNLVRFLRTQSWYSGGGKCF